MFKCSHACGGQRSRTGASINHSPPLFLRQSLSERLELIYSLGCGLQGPTTPALPAVGPQEHTTIQAQVFTLVQRALYQLNHLLAPPSDMLAYFRDGNLTVEPWLTWNSICRPGCPQSQKRSICLSLTSAEIKGEYCY